MKRTIIGLLLLVAIVAMAARGVPRTTVTLAWDYPTNEISSDMVFRVYSSPTIANPTWTLLTAVSVTNLVAGNMKVTLPIQSGAHYFTVTVSNYWMESDFSNVASTPPLPRSDVNLRIE